MIAATYESALAMVGDIQHMREVVEKPEPTPGDIWRLSNPLRRILIENNGDLRKIAPPRIGRIKLLVPDILPPHPAGGPGKEEASECFPIGWRSQCVRDKRGRLDGRAGLATT
jgi:hypothetical protein